MISTDYGAIKIPARQEPCDTIVWVCGDCRFFFNGSLVKFLGEIQLDNYYLQANPGGLLRLYTSRDALDSIMEYCKYIEIKEVVIITHCTVPGAELKATCKYEAIVYGMASIINLYQRAKKSLSFVGVNTAWYHAEIENTEMNFIKID